MSQVKTNKAKWLAVILVVIIAGGLIWVSLARRPQAPEVPPVAEVTPAPEEVPETAEVVEDITLEPEEELLDIDDIGIAGIIEEESENIQPVTWKPHIFDGEPENFSPEDFEVAKRLMERYRANFAKIQTLKVHSETSYHTFSDEWIGQEMVRLRKGTTRDVEATRSPLYFKMQVTHGDEQSEVVVTPVGKTGNMRSRGESWIPPYLEGESGFQPASLLEVGDRVEQDVAMDMDLPGLEEYTNNAKGSRYDVIVNMNRNYIWDAAMKTEKIADMEEKYWFNRENGMLEFVTRVKKADDEDSTMPLLIATVYTWQQAGDVYYMRRRLKRSTTYQYDVVQDFTDVVINGIAADD